MKNNQIKLHSFLSAPHQSPNFRHMEDDVLVISGPQELKKPNLEDKLHTETPAPYIRAWMQQ